MGVRLYETPEVENPVLIASWPGIGNIGIIAVNYLIQVLKARQFGEIEPWDFFYPNKVVIRDGILQDIEFPASKFYSCRAAGKDLILFVGEEQPVPGGGAYAEGEKAYQIANHVLDVAVQLGCRRVYTSGAAVAPIHHTSKPRVWAVPNTGTLIGEIEGYENTVLMSGIESRGGQGNISGLNGLLLGVARKRGLDAICVMGEIPFYLRGVPVAYPKASKSVVELLSRVLEIKVDFSVLDRMIDEVDEGIKQLEVQFYQQVPPEIAERIRNWVDSFKSHPAATAPITDEDQQWIREHIDELFKWAGEGGEKPQ